MYLVVTLNKNESNFGSMKIYQCEKVSCAFIGIALFLTVVEPRGTSQNLGRPLSRQSDGRIQKIPSEKRFHCGFELTVSVKCMIKICI